MTELRSTAAVAFLTEAGWHSAGRVTIAGDASNRRYDRLTNAAGQTAILMDAPPDRGEDVRPFQHITRTLRAMGLSAPEILAADDTHGFLLLEDLGDDLFARVIAAKPSLENSLYEAATDTLIHLHRHPCPDLAPYDAETMAPLAALAFDWYLFGATGVHDTAAKALFQTLCQDYLRPLDQTLNVLIQRDYHAENLVWLPHRSGVARVGLLDYQDAMRGHCAYDLVSILQDARRDVSPELARRMIMRYVSATGVDPDQFALAYALLGMQRNMRILGVFARLSMAYGKPDYVDLIPRVWGHLIASLGHSELAGLAPKILDVLPEPDGIVLETLKEKCGSLSE